MKELLLLLTFIMSKGLIAAPIHDAAESGNIDAVIRLTESGVGLNDTDFYNYETPLYKAVLNNHINIVDILIENGAYVYLGKNPYFTPDDSPIGGSETPLDCALRIGNFDIASMLIKHDAYSDNIPQIHLYAWNDDVEKVRILLDKNLDINTADKNGITTLHIAARANRIEVVKLLIDRGADVNLKSVTGNTALHLAVKFGHLAMVRLLLDNWKCNYTIANSNHEIPENIARSLGHVEIVDMLYNAQSIRQKILGTGKGLQLLAAIAVNNYGISNKEKDRIPYSVRHLITNIRKPHTYCLIQ